MIIANIIENLKKVRGLDNIILLNKKDFEFIKNNEEPRNLGVFECLNRKYVVVLTHDSSFREPEDKIVRIKDKKLIFPLRQLSLSGRAKSSWVKIYV